MAETFYKLPAEIAERRDLSGTEKVIWSILRRRAGSRGYCWPGLGRLAKDAGTSRRTAIRAVAILVRKRLLIKKRYKERAATGGIQYLTNVYTFPGVDIEDDRISR